MAPISLTRLTKTFGSTSVLKNVSLEIADGEFLTLLGPSGCGKSTLLRILAGLEAQDSGTVAIGGRTVDSLRPKQRDVAMVFQSYALYPHMTVDQNIALPLRMRRLSPAQRLPLFARLSPRTRAALEAIEREVGRTAAALEITHLLHQKPGQLSGGQRQRVALGRAMVRHPAVFLMDEPLSNLDAKLRVQMRAEIKELHQRLGVTFVYVTHDQAEAMTMSDRVAVMLEGELLQVAPPQTIYADPVCRRVAEFVGSPKINLIEGRLREPNLVDAAGTVFLIEAARSLRTNGAITLGIRPEAFRLSERSGPGTVTGRVRLLEHLGSDLFVHVDAPGAAPPVIARLLAERAGAIRPDQTVHLAVQSDRLLAFDAAGHRLSSGAEPATVTPIRSYA